MAKPVGRYRQALEMERNIQQGPISSVHQKYVAIAKFHQLNFQRIQENHKEISISEFEAWTGIPELDIRTAATDKEYIEVSRAIAKADISLWMQTQLPALQAAAEEMKRQKQSAEYVKLMLNIADMVKFKEADFSNLRPREDKDATAIIKELIGTVRKIVGPDISDQKIIAFLSEEPDRAPADKTAGAVDEATRQAGGIEVHQGDRPPVAVSAVPETRESPDNGQAVHVPDGGEPDREVVDGGGNSLSLPDGETPKTENT